MARPSGPKTRCGGRWTEAKFRSFIKNNLRRATNKWQPIQECKTKARVARGLYICACCGEEVENTTKDENGIRTNNIFIDHINPIIDPDVGFTTWDECIDRMFCELENLQLMCKECHDNKTNKEKEIAKERRARSKEFEEDF